MVFTILDTPRTEIGDQTRMSGFNDPDFSTANSIPSPSKESNDLLKQIRGMRSSANGVRSPRSRLPLTDRRNAAAKGEFTPLLKSATRNSFIRSSGPGKENYNSQLETPAGLKASYGRDNSPGLPFNSSVMIEEHTGSSVGNEEDQRSILAPPISSSSALSTPMVIAHRTGEGALDHRGNLATLRDQEERLEQIDKENFSLKLKIHFLEEALRKNGKEFNETALKENTELKVDKVTLQRDLKHYRKLLAQADKDLADYKQQLKDYVEKMKQRHVNEDMQEELEQLRRNVAEGESKIDELQVKLNAMQKLQEEVERLKDDCSDLEAEIRRKDQELDEKDEELQTLRESGSSDEHLKEQLEEKTKLLEEKDEDIEGLQEALRNAETITEQKLQEKQRLLEEKDDELLDLEEQLKDQSLIRSRDQEGQKLLEQKEEEIRELKQRIEASAGDESVLRKNTSEVDDQKNQIQHLQEELSGAVHLKEQAQEQRQELQANLQAVENESGSEIRKLNRTIEEKDFEIRTLEQKLSSADGRDADVEKLQDQVADLESDLRERERLVEAKEDEIDKLNAEIRETKQQADDELIEYEDRVQELESEQQRHLSELQQLRDSKNTASEGRSQALEDAKTRINELEDQQQINLEQEKDLQTDVNKLHDQIKRLESSIREKEATYAQGQDKWAEERRSLELQKTRTEEQVIGLQRTITQLHETEGTLSGREMQLQRALQSEGERHRSDQESLQKQLSAAKDESEKHRTAWQQTQSGLRDAQDELSEIKPQLKSSKEQERSLREKVQGLEDEIELLQCSLDEDAERAQSDIGAAKQEAESLRRQLRGLQQDLAIAQRQQSEAIPTAANSDAEGFDVPPANHQALRGSNQLPQKLRDLQDQLSRAKNEKISLQDDLAVTNADLDALHSTVSQLESSRGMAQQQVRELRKQLQDLHREHERKSQSQILSYEQDIQNLEQDLMDANAKQAELEAKNQGAEQQAGRLQAKVKSLDAELANVRAQRTSGDTSVAERKDLHEMLKDAKLEAEDLTIQIKERDGRIAALTSKDTELRDQLRHLREERSAQSSRSDTLAKDLEDLQRRYDDLNEEISSLRAMQKQVRFPGSSVSAANNASAATADELAAVGKRHAAELRGLVKQIEYLAARCKREGRFRADLSYVKQYFTKQVEMHGRCTQADLRLVRAMGIRVNDVLEEQQADEEARRGRVQTWNGTRPSLKCVALMVVAGVRMRKGAEQWAAVKKGHEALVRKLKDLHGHRVHGGKSLDSTKEIHVVRANPRPKRKASQRRAED